jgi:hypothetical protein
MCLSIISTVIIGWLTLIPAPLQRRSCPSSSIPRSFLAPLLSIRHSDMPWLAPPIRPHPEVELIQPTSVAPLRAGIGNSSIAVAKSMWQGGRAVSSHKARHHWHTTKHVLSSAQIKARQISAAGTVVEHGHSFSLHDGINQQIDGLECAEENQSKLSVPASVAETAHGSHCAVEEQLGPGIPQQAFTAQDHVRCKIKLVYWLWIVLIGGNQADTVLPKPISNSNMLYIVLYIVLYNMLYRIIRNMLHSMLHNMFYKSVL